MGAVRCGTLGTSGGEFDMATIAPRFDEAAPGERFFSGLAIAMALTIVAGFSFQLSMGRSTFAAPARVHFHAIVFMGWVAIFLAQTWFATRGPLALHRRLGWLATGWLVLMVIAGLAVTTAMARNGTVPFFFLPQHFLISDPMTLFAFVGLTIAAVAMRKRTDWHARLHIGGMTMLMGPGFGRLLPMPFMTPWRWRSPVLRARYFRWQAWPAIGAATGASILPGWCAWRRSSQPSW